MGLLFLNFSLALLHPSQIVFYCLLQCHWEGSAQGISWPDLELVLWFPETAASNTVSSDHEGNGRHPYQPHHIHSNNAFFLKILKITIILFSQSYRYPCRQKQISSSSLVIFCYHEESYGMSWYREYDIKATWTIFVLCNIFGNYAIRVMITFHFFWIYGKIFIKKSNALVLYSRLKQWQYIDTDMMLNITTLVYIIILLHRHHKIELLRYLKAP